MPLITDRERADLEDRSAKRRRFDASTEDNVTFRSLLAKAAEGVSDVKGFEDKARQMSMGLEVWKAFGKHISGNHSPHQYKAEAADAIAKFINESVAANTRGTTKDMRSYYQVVPDAAIDTGDLYDSSWATSTRCKSGLLCDAVTKKATMRIKVNPQVWFSSAGADLPSLSTWHLNS